MLQYTRATATCRTCGAINHPPPTRIRAVAPSCSSVRLRCEAADLRYWGYYYETKLCTDFCINAASLRTWVSDSDGKANDSPLL